MNLNVLRSGKNKLPYCTMKSNIVTNTNHLVKRRSVGMYLKQEAKNTLVSGRWHSSVALLHGERPVDPLNLVTVTPNF